MHVVAVVVQTVVPLANFTVYVTTEEFGTTDQVRTVDLLAVDAVNVAGARGGPVGVTDADEAPFPFALDATTVMR